MMPRTDLSPARRNSRSRNGVAGSIEIIGCGLFVIILALLGMDVSLAIFGASINDHACRDAARAAAGGSSKTKAWTLAQAATRMYHTDGLFITQPTLLGPSAPQFDYNDYGGAPPTDTSPYVTVTTHCLVKIPAPIFFMGASFVKDGKAEFTQSYTFPIVRTNFIKYADAG